MKKTSTLIILMLVFLCIVSCSFNDRTQCWYAYFGRKAVMLGYSNKNNTLYAINLPVQDIASWAKNNNIKTMDSAIRDYTGISEVAFFTGHEESYEAICTILETIGSDGSVQGNLETIAANAQVLSKQPLLDKISRLCGTSYESLVSLINKEKPKTSWIDSEAFITTVDGSSREYLQTWLRQTL